MDTCLVAVKALTMLTKSCPKPVSAKAVAKLHAAKVACIINETTKSA